MADHALPNLRKALKLAWKAHKGTDRDGVAPLPYATHPFDVVNILRYVGGVVDEEVLCAGALHDTLEDTDLRPEEIEKLFGARVLALVREVTRREPSEEETRGLTPKKLWTMRSEILLAEIGQMSPIAQTIKLSDRLSNLTAALTSGTPDKLARMIPQTKRILEIVPEAVCPPVWRRIRHLLDAAAN